MEKWEGISTRLLDNRAEKGPVPGLRMQCSLPSAMVSLDQTGPRQNTGSAMAASEKEERSNIISTNIKNFPSSKPPEWNPFFNRKPCEES